MDLLTRTPHKVDLIARLVRRFEVPTPPAATSVRNFKSKSGTRIIELLVPLSFRSFVSECAEVYHELRKRGTSLRP